MSCACLLEIIQYMVSYNIQYIRRKNVSKLFRESTLMQFAQQMNIKEKKEIINDLFYAVSGPENPCTILE